MALDQKDALIVAQNSATGAAAIVAGLSPKSIDQALEAFETIRAAIFEGTFALAGVEDVDTVRTVVSAPRSTNRGGGNRSGGGGGNRNPGDVDFRGGKFAGKTIAAVYDEDPSYLEWCVGNMKNDFMVARIEEYLASVN